MNITERLTAELRREAGSTRKVLERVPERSLSWRPHDKSMSLGQLALHMAWLPGALAELLDAPSRELPDVPLPEAASVNEILAAFETHAADAESKLRSWGEAGLAETFTLTVEGAPVMEASRYEMARTLLFNHWYHHRGQITVYLRLLDVPVPGVYGPSADEG